MRNRLETSYKPKTYGIEKNMEKSSPKKYKKPIQDKKNVKNFINKRNDVKNKLHNLIANPEIT